MKSINRFKFFQIKDDEEDELDIEFIEIDWFDDYDEDQNKNIPYC